MEFIVIFMIILILSMALSMLFHKNIEQTIPITVMGMTLMTYLLGLFNQLKAGIMILFFLTGMAFVYETIEIIQKGKQNKRKEITKKILTPGLVVYTILFIIFVWSNRNTIFTFYDEFNHWGLMTKNMYSNHTLNIQPDSLIKFNEYPPFTAIFQYLFLVVRNGYSESTIVIASNILYLSIMIPIFKNIKWKENLKMLILYVPVILFLPMLFYEDFHRLIIVDGFMGILWAYSLFIWYTEKQGKYRTVAVTLGVVSLALVKYSGIWLSILAILIIIGDCFLRRKQKQIQEEWKRIGIVIFTFLLFVVSWQIKIQTEKAHKEWNMQNMNLTSFQQEMTKESSLEIIKNYTNYLWQENVVTDKNVTVVGIFLLLMAYFIATYGTLEEAEKKKRYRYYAIALMGSIIIYSGMLLLTYLLIIPKEESIYMVCFARYMNTILLGVSMFGMMLFLENHHQLKGKNLVISICLMLAIFPTVSITHQLFSEKNERLVELKERKSLMEILKYQNQMKKEDKIYYLTNVGDLQERKLKIARYIMMPIRIENSRIITQMKGLEEELQKENYTHLYIEKIEEKLEEKLEQNFAIDIKEETMYQIKKEGEKMKLVELE